MTGLIVLLLFSGALIWQLDRRAQERRMFEAATAGDTATIRSLLASGVSPNARERREKIEAPRHSGIYWSTRWQTPLHFAASSGGKDSVSLLLQSGARVNAAGVDGNTALMLAVEWQEVDVVRQLLVAGADPNHQEWEQGNTALHFAASRGEVPILRALLDAGAAVDVANLQGSTPLCEAAGKRHFQAVELLLMRGAAVHIRDARPPLFLAAQHGDAKIARLLLAHGADPREKHDGLTPRQIALNNRHFETARLLHEAERTLKRGAAVASEQRPAPWKRARAVRHWDEVSERLAVTVIFPWILTWLDLRLLWALWRADGLRRLESLGPLLPLRGRWLRILLTVVLVIAGVPLCTYSCLMLYFCFEWLARVSQPG